MAITSAINTVVTTSATNKTLAITSANNIGHKPIHTSGNTISHHGNYISHNKNLWLTSTTKTTLAITSANEMAIQSAIKK